MKESSSLITSTSVFGLLLALVLACSSGRRDSATDANHIIKYNRAAKILVQYIPSKNETNVYHYVPVDDAKRKDPPLKPDLIVDGRTIHGKHTFEFFDMVGFAGRTPSETPTNTSLSVTHSVASRKEWHFPPKSKLTFIADGATFDVPVHAQIELKKDDPSDAEFYEVLITKPTFDMYAKIANAKSVTVQIATASFKLDADIIASYGDFITYLTPPR